MNANRKTATLVGALFLIAMVSSLLGGIGFIEPILSAPDYLAAISENEAQLVIGVLLELLNGLAVLGIGVLMFPILKRYSECIAAGYLGFRIVESVFCCAIVISPLSLIALSQRYLQAGTAEAASLQSVGVLAIAERASVSNLLIPVFLSVGALLLYYQMYHSRLLPRFIAVWGLIAAMLILVLNLLLTFGIEIGMGLGMVFALPMITNEIFMGIWLIVKGFSASALAAGPAKADM